MPRGTHPPDPPNRALGSRSPAYSHGSRSGSTEIPSNEDQNDQSMVDLTGNEEPAESFTQEENEEHFIEELLERVRICLAVTEVVMVLENSCCTW